MLESFAFNVVTQALVATTHLSVTAVGTLPVLFFGRRHDA